MILTHPLIEAIRTGRKTTTRVPAASGIVRCPYQPGKHYGVRRRARGAEILRVEIVNVRREPLGAIDEDAATAEGFKSRAAFLSFWYGRHGEVNLEQLVWVVQHFLYERPLLLAKRGGYTSDPWRALHDEPEAIRLDTKPAAPPVPTATQQKPRDLVAELEQRLRLELLNRFEGEEPEDVSAIAPHQGTPGDIRARRRRMGYRGIDGLPPFTPDQIEAGLAHMLADPRTSVRDVARFLDCSVGKAQGILSSARVNAA